MFKRLALLLLFLPALAAAQIQEPPQWDSTTNFIGGGLVRCADGNYYRCIRTNTGVNPLTDNHTDWELYYARAAVSLTVASSGARFASLQRAWDFVSSATIANTVIVSIKINTAKGAFSESYPNGLTLNATGGSQIQISGDDPTKITLSATFGVLVSSSHALGSLSNVTIKSPQQAGAGITVQDGSEIHNLTGVTVNNYTTGVLVTHKSLLVATRCSVLGYLITGVSISGNSHVNFDLGTITGTNFSQSDGLFCSEGSFASASGTVVTKSWDGIKAELGATINANGASVTNCGHDGFTAVLFGNINAAGATSTGNALHGIECTGSSRIWAVNSTVNSNTGGDYSPAPNSVDSQGNFIGN